MGLRTDFNVPARRLTVSPRGTDSGQVPRMKSHMFAGYTVPFRASIALSAMLVAAGCGNDEPEFLFPPPPVTVSTGDHFACGLTSSGEAYCWGRNSEGQLGDGSRVNRPTPARVRTGLRFHDISAGWWGHSCGVSLEGDAYCWGANEHGQLGDGSTESRSQPRAVYGGLKFRDISAGTQMTCGVTVTGEAYCWGSPAYSGSLGSMEASASTRPIRVDTDVLFTKIDTHWQMTCGLSVEGEAWCWGFSAPSGIGHELGKRPSRVADGVQFKRFVSGMADFCGITRTDDLYCWIASDPISPLGGRVLIGDQYRLLATGAEPLCAVTNEDQAMCWNVTREYRVNAGDAHPVTPPIRVIDKQEVKRISRSISFACAVVGSSSGDQVWCWGRNEFGQLGNGEFEDSREPVRVNAPLR